MLTGVDLTLPFQFIVQKNHIPVSANLSTKCIKVYLIHFLFFNSSYLHPDKCKRFVAEVIPDQSRLME